MTVVAWCVLALEVYLGTGLLFAIPFALRWVRRVDPVAAGGSWGFRVLIVPGVSALWPLFAWRLARARVEGGER